MRNLLGNFVIHNNKYINDAKLFHYCFRSALRRKPYDVQKNKLDFRCYSLNLDFTLEIVKEQKNYCVNFLPPSLAMRLE